LLITIVAFIFVFSVLVFFHEFGHFISAKISGVKVYRFAFGMGPKIFGFTKNETEYLVCLIPIGGYVKMAGEIGQEDADTTTEVPEDQRFDKKSLGIRALIVALGPFMNIFISVVLFSLIFLVEGIPVVTNSIASVIEGGPADQAGFLPGDKIIAINSAKINDQQEIAEIISKNVDKTLKITVDRKGENIDLYVVPKYEEDYQKGMIGIEFEVTKGKINIFSAFREGLFTTGKVIGLIFSSTTEMISGKVPLEIAGPLGIAQMTGEVAKLGFLNLLSFTAILSIFIGLFNLLPIPALDGGHILLLVIEKLRGKSLEAERINLIYLIGISIIMFIFIFATYKDISRILFNK